MSKIRLQQFIIIGVILLILGFIYSRDITALKPEENKTAGMEANTTTEAEELNLDDISRVGKNIVGGLYSKEIEALENKFKTSKGESRLELAAQLADKWNDVEQLTPSALYLEIVASEKNSLNDWINSGDRLIAAFENESDSVVKPALLIKANTAFSKALAIDSTNLDAKTGMGTTIVNGMGAPMDGIFMLVDVVKKDPKNLKAIMQLGLFSVKSGQFDRAIERFKEAIKLKETSEAYFYLATAYENLNRNDEAIEAYLNSKRIAANPTLSKFIDKKVAELKN